MLSEEMVPLSTVPPYLAWQPEEQQQAQQGQLELEVLGLEVLLELAHYGVLSSRPQTVPASQVVSELDWETIWQRLEVVPVSLKTLPGEQHEVDLMHW